MGTRGPWTPACLGAAALVLTALGTARADDGLALFLRRGSSIGAGQLSPQTPTRGAFREDELSLLSNTTGTFGPFVLPGSGQMRTVPRGLGQVFAYLTAGDGDAIAGCAEISTRLLRMPVGGSPLVLASGTFSGVSLESGHVATSPLEFLLSITGDRGARTVLAGEHLGLDITVRHLCGGVRTVTLRYDARTHPSQIALADNCPGIPNPDQLDDDDDGRGNACDNCRAVGNADQDDVDADSFGDACDNCALAANPDQANADGDARGDICDLCPAETGEAGDPNGCPCASLDCDDRNACTTDICTAGVGCQHQDAVALDAVRCRVSGLRDAMAGTGPAGLAPELTRPRGRLSIALRRVDRVIAQVDTARLRGRPRRIERAKQRLELALHRLVLTIDRAYAKGLIQPAVRDGLLAFATAAAHSVRALVSFP